MHDEAYELEKYMIPSEDWHTAPQDVREEAERADAEGIPAGIAHHPEKGWFVLHAGQGPYIAYRQK